MSSSNASQGSCDWRGYLATLLLTLTLGSIHAFSIFVVPFEWALDSSRSQVSLIYSLALISLTVAVLLGHKIYPLLRHAYLAFGAMILAAAGLWLASLADSLPTALVGYGIIFGFANGLGYGLALVIAAKVWPRRQALTMASVTAAYALGATVFVKIFDHVNQIADHRQALIIGAFIIACAGLASFVLLLHHRSSSQGTQSKEGSAVGSQTIFLCWLTYGAGTCAGLMAIGHAAPIAAAAGAPKDMLVVAAMIIGFGNALGGLGAGFLSEWLSLRRILIALPAASLLLLVVLAFQPGSLLTVLVLGLVGLVYGAIIALFPVAVLRLAGEREYPRVYGLVFTAWGLAGLIGPWSAGKIFDLAQSYMFALLLAAALALMAVLLSTRLPRS